MVKNTEDLLKCMLGADDPWYQVKSFVTTAIKEKVLSNEKGRRDLLFSACWIAENYKTLKDQNKMLGEKLEDLKGHYNALKITASTASAMCVNYHKTVNENSALKVENEELLGRLRDAEGAIRCLGALLNQPQVDHSHCKSEIEHLKAQLRRKDAVVAAFNVPGNPITGNWESIAHSLCGINDNSCMAAPMAPIAVHIKTGTDGEEISRTRVETSLSNSDITVLSRELGPVRIDDDPVDLMLRIQNFQKVHHDLKDSDVFNVISSSLDHGIKASIPSSVYRTCNSLSSLMDAVLDILGWDINAAHSAFVTCKQRREEPVQAFSERLYTLYSCTVQKPAKADLEDNVFKSALLTQSLPEIYQLVGLTVGPANSYLEVIDCLKRAESVVKECQRDFKSNIPVVKVSQPIRKMNTGRLTFSPNQSKKRCYACGNLGHIAMNCTATTNCSNANVQSSPPISQITMLLQDMQKDIEVLKRNRLKANAIFPPDPALHINTQSDVDSNQES
uniref:CCHC-type domain-containing protein n=1 Tax=Xenopus tropicalis TaxID=8364 RepID=A0A803JMY1_XENTR